MAIALVAHQKAASVGGANCTTPAIDTTGANLLVVAIADFESGSTVLSDSKGNTWTPLTRRAAVGSGAVQLYYCASPTVGSGHTFTATATASFPAIFAAAFSGAHTSPFDAESAGTVFEVAAGPRTTIDNANLTPSQNNALVVTGLGGGGVSILIDESFIITDSADLSGGNNFAGGLAYIIQTTAGATSPTWSWTNNSSGVAAASASFKVAAAGGTINGVLAQTLGALTVVAAGNLTVNGVLAQTLGALTASAAGTVGAVGAGSSAGITGITGITAIT